jgi:hypothetical protein
MMTQKMLLVGFLIALSSSACAEDWKLYSDNPSPQATTECFVGTKPGLYYKYEVSKHKSEQAACKDAKTRKVDPTHQEFGKCPSYTKDTLKNCKTAGVPLD